MTPQEWQVQCRTARDEAERRRLAAGDVELTHHERALASRKAVLDVGVSVTLEEVNGILRALAAAQQRHETARQVQQQAEAEGKRQEQAIRRRLALDLETLRNQFRRDLDEGWRAAQRAEGDAA